MICARICLALLIVLAAAAVPAFAEVKVTMKDAYMSPELHVPVPEAPQVVAVLQKLLVASQNGDASAYATLLTEDTTQYDETAKKEIVGKDNVLAALKARFEAAAQRAKTGTHEVVVERPYVKVSGESAVVTYKIVTHGAPKLYTNIFTKTPDGWKKSFDRGELGS